MGSVASTATGGGSAPLALERWPGMKPLMGQGHSRPLGWPIMGPAAGLVLLVRAGQGNSLDRRQHRRVERPHPLHRRQQLGQVSHHVHLLVEATGA